MKGAYSVILPSVFSWLVLFSIFHSDYLNFFYSFQTFPFKLNKWLSTSLREKERERIHQMWAFSISCHQTYKLNLQPSFLFLSYLWLHQRWSFCSFLRTVPPLVLGFSSCLLKDPVTLVLCLWNSVAKVSKWFPCGEIKWILFYF